MKLSLKAVDKSYLADNKSIDVMKGFDLELSGGDFVAIHGKSGCGKSSMLLVTGGLMRPQKGSVVIDDCDIYQLSKEERASFRSKNIGFVFQEFYLVPYLNIKENILAASLSGGSALEARADELIEKFGLSHRKDHLPKELSTGERQRTALARAFLNKPGLILADEPTGNLDTENAEIVLSHLKEFAATGGMVLLVTHDARCAAYAQKSYALEGGQVS